MFREKRREILSLQATHFHGNIFFPTKTVFCKKQNTKPSLGVFVWHKNDGKSVLDASNIELQVFNTWRAVHHP